MKKDFLSLIDINQDEVLRYLEYKGQEISKELIEIINECRDFTKQRINPRYILRVYSLKHKSENSKRSEIIKLEGTNINLESRDLYDLLKNCNKCIVMAATLGIEIEREIRKYSYQNLTKGIIIDACATTAIEEICDLIQSEIKIKLLKDGKYITQRYSPGYGDLSIFKNIDIINLLDSSKEIGLTITQNGIMIPRKSVIAIIGISDSVTIHNTKSCKNCKNNTTCKYRKEVEGCGYKGIHKE
ncbi:Vitamin B12 dependent methionine synthase, activation domain protein [Romboutsia maritimum]|uniref:Vitamin B12 dependent methionine synthase, activation domain protein n=1 Tax=Romboutsia maritimum TaxID=2020948 RepID=A0A371IRA7_9FIRM|nr:vitamin B12 dependent-methionine synthase activation domain-containing protein [Romboutsia maritimum]RDY23016.1 Vitamin B12 dependent methionine synthase, activation domain protein [Romboutsia maritimum]